MTLIKISGPICRPYTLNCFGYVFDSLNWQHSLCSNPRQNPDIRTLSVDHSCKNSNDSYAQLAASNQLIGSTMKIESFLHNQPFQPTSAPFQTPLNAWMSNPSTVTHPAVSGGFMGFGSITNSGSFKLLL